MKNIVFTDLDGTLLGLDTYSAEKVKEHVKKLKEANVPIIFCSSKTWAEQDFYQEFLDLNEPAIVENGSGIIIPVESKLEFSLPSKINRGKKIFSLGENYDKIVKTIKTCEELSNSNYKYYHNLSIEAIAEITGLHIAAARKAKTRDFSETLFDADLTSDSYNKFEQEIQSHGLQCMPGSRYVTITDIKSNKGTAVSLVVEAYRKKYKDVKTVGIGDSRNDLEMLEMVDSPYLVKRPDNNWASVDVENLTKIDAVGPDGWNIMAEEILAD